MGLVEDVLAYAFEEASDCEVSGACLGLRYSCVLLRDGRCGVAYRFRGWMSDGCCYRHVRTGFEAARLALDWDLNVASLGTAALNSVLPDPGGVRVDGYGRIAELCRDAGFVVFVGYFKPFLDLPRRYVVLEKSYYEGVLPDEAYSCLLYTSPSPRDRG